MKKLTLTIAALLIALSSFGKMVIHVHEYTYTYDQTTKGYHVKNGILEAKKGFKLIGITFNVKSKTVTYGYSDSKEIEITKVIQAKYQVRVY